MALTNLSQITTSGIATGTDLNIRNITGVAATFTGNVTVGGTLTYDDVTNIDSVGLITARSGINVTSGDVNLTSGNLALASATPMVVASNGSGSLRLGAGGSEKVRITSGGLVGIGTITPGSALEIRTTTTNAATHYRNNASNGGAYFGVRATDLGAASAGEAYIYSYNSGINLLADGTGHIDFATGGTASKVRITSGGFVGINNTSPELQSSSARNLVIGTPGSGGQNGLTICSNTSGTNNIYFGDASSGTGESTGRIVYSHADDSLTFHTVAQERLRITSAGLVGIGTNIPSSPLHLQSTSSNQSVLTISANNARTAHIKSPFVSDSTTPFTFFTNNAWRFDVDSIRVLTMTHDYKVGIRTDNPEEELSVQLDSSIDGPTLRLRNANGGDGTFLGRISTGDAASTFFAGINFLKHDTNDGEIRLRTKVAGTNTDVVTIVDGNVGIGTDNPEANLQIQDASEPTVSLWTGSTKRSAFQGQSTGTYIYSYQGQPLLFSVGSGNSFSEKLRIDSDGRLLAGGATASNAWTGGDDLVIGNTGSGKRTGITLVSHSGSDGGLYWSDGTGASVYRGQLTYNHASDTMAFYTAASSKLSIDTNGHMRLSSGDLRVGDNTNSNAGTQTISVGSVSSGSGGIGIFANPTNGNSFVQFGDGTSSADQYRGYMNYRHADDSLRLGTAGTDRIHITDAGMVGINMTPGTAGNSTYMLQMYNAGSQCFMSLGQGSGNGPLNGLVMGVSSAAHYITGRENLPMIFATNDTERLRINSAGGHRIQCDESWHAANLSECNTEKLALNINKTRQGQTKGIAIGCVGSGSGATGIQAYDTSNNSANTLEINPFGGNLLYGDTASDLSSDHKFIAVGTKHAFQYDGNAGTYLSVILSPANGTVDLEADARSGNYPDLRFMTTNDEQLRVLAAGHIWKKGDGALWHGTTDINNFSNAGRSNYNKVSIRAGDPNDGTSPTNDNSAIKIYPAGNRGTAVGTLSGGIAWQHLDPDNGSWDTAYGAGSQIWMGSAIHDTPGQERSRFNLWMNSGTTGNSQPGNLAIEAYPNGMVRHPKVPAFMVRSTSNTSAFTGNARANWTTVILDNGSNFSTSNDVFTAPIDGIYYFSCMMLSNAGIRLFHEFRVNGTRVDGTRSEGHAVANSYQTNTITMTYSLSASDYVEVWVGPNNAYGGTYSNFNGFLVG